jgi:hypothetical protein
MLDPIVSRTFNMLARAGQLPEAPPIVLESGAELDIEYLGALPRAQRVDQAAAIERWITLLGGVAQVMPSVLDVPDEHEVARELGRSLNISPSLMNDEAEVQQANELRKKQQAEAMESQQAGMKGQAMESLGKGQQALSEANPQAAPLEAVP